MLPVWRLTELVLRRDLFWHILSSVGVAVAAEDTEKPAWVMNPSYTWAAVLAKED